MEVASEEEEAVRDGIMLLHCWAAVDEADAKGEIMEEVQEEGEQEEDEEQEQEEEGEERPEGVPDPRPRKRTRTQPPDEPDLKGQPEFVWYCVLCYALAFMEDRVYTGSDPTDRLSLALRAAMRTCCPTARFRMDIACATSSLDLALPLPNPIHRPSRCRDLTLADSYAKRGYVGIVEHVLWYVKHSARVPRDYAEMKAHLRLHARGLTPHSAAWQLWLDRWSAAVSISDAVLRTRCLGADGTPLPAFPPPRSMRPTRTHGARSDEVWDGCLCRDAFDLVMAVRAARCARQLVCAARAACMAALWRSQRLLYSTRTRAADKYEEGARHEALRRRAIRLARRAYKAMDLLPRESGIWRVQAATDGCSLSTIGAPRELVLNRLVIVESAPPKFWLVKSGSSPSAAAKGGTASRGTALRRNAYAIRRWTIPGLRTTVDDCERWLLDHPLSGPAPPIRMCGAALSIQHVLCWLEFSRLHPNEPESDRYMRQIARDARLRAFSF